MGIQRVCTRRASVGIRACAYISRRGCEPPVPGSDIGGGGGSPTTAANCATKVTHQLYRSPSPSNANPRGRARQFNP